MRKLMVLFLAQAMLAGANGQTESLSGRVEYEQVKKLTIKLQGMDEEISKMLPKERKSTKELVFNAEASLFRNMEKSNEEDVISETSGGAAVMIKMQEPEEFVYSDLVEKTCVEQREFMSRKFLITSATDTIKWKITGNQRLILDIPCMEAELVGSENKTLAWFAPSIPVSTGPEGFAGLPGLILAVDVKEGEQVTMAKSLEMKPIDKNEFVQPTEGKKVTRAEFKKIVADKKKEMEAEGGGGVFIIRQN